jgi:hypothetical protein
MITIARLKFSTILISHSHRPSRRFLAGWNHVRQPETSCPHSEERRVPPPRDDAVQDQVLVVGVKCFRTRPYGVKSNPVRWAAIVSELRRFRYVRKVFFGFAARGLKPERCSLTRPFGVDHRSDGSILLVQPGGAVVSDQPASSASETAELRTHF